MTMKALPLVLALFAQDLFAQELLAQKAWLVRGDAPDVADARVVTGTPELQPDLARQVAIDQAVDDFRESRRQRGLAIARERAPHWLPDRVTDKVVQRWLSPQDLRATLEILDRDQRVRDHGFGQSYQASVLVRANPKKCLEAEKVLAWEIDHAAKRLKQGLGLTIAGWVGLAFLVSWLDRLSRGYMTLRLWSLAAIVGLVFPAGLFFA